MSETQVSERPVLKAIAAIMGEVGSVEKRGRNDFHRYDYATAADIAHALQKRMADAGLIIVPNQRSMTLLDDGNVLAIEFEFMVEHVSGDRLTDRPVFTGMAAARNTKGGFDDKAANKCLTAASKYFALNLFRIPTGDYHDADGDEGAPARGRAAQKPATAHRPTTTAPKAQPPQQPAASPAAASGKRDLDWPSVQARNVPKDKMAETLASGMSECIRIAEDATALAELEAANKTALDWLVKAVPAGHAQIKRQIAARLDEIAHGPNAMAGI